MLSKIISQKNFKLGKIISKPNKYNQQLNSLSQIRKFSKIIGGKEGSTVREI